MTSTSEKSLYVLIAGAGIGGLSLAIFLERAGIDYTVIERSSSMKTIGGALGLTAQIFRAFDQIGMFHELAEVSAPLSGITYFNHKMEKVGRLDGSNWEERYGYTHRLVPRRELMDVLLRHVPPHKIQWNKKITSAVQNDEGVSVVCADGTHFEADILIGSDGAYSTVRSLLFKSMQEKGHKMDVSDLENLRFNQFAVIGLTSDISDEYPVLKKSTSEMEHIVNDKKKAYNICTIPLPGGRVNWLVGGNFDIDAEDQEKFRFSDWSSEAAKTIFKEIENLPCAIGGTLSNLLKKTDKAEISRVMLEDKIFKTWYDGRICLMGDAVHKTLPAGGQGANQAILDAICLANLLHELPSTSVEDITKMFAKYREIRFNGAKRSVVDSAMITNVICKQGTIGDIMRAVILDWSPVWVINMNLDALLCERPVLTFEPSFIDKGDLKDKSKPHTLQN
ncbi:hypothetical protein BGW42_005977 [Actinomortierella wolfii]|nr:hypothetical protein BGW42_005977 [Actinomortierella wolfii]